jgi:hypothetical protein
MNFRLVLLVAALFGQEAFGDIICGFVPFEEGNTWVYLVDSNSTFSHTLSSSYRELHMQTLKVMEIRIKNDTMTAMLLVRDSLMSVKSTMGLNERTEYPDSLTTTTRRFLVFNDKIISDGAPAADTTVGWFPSHCFGYRYLGILPSLCINQDSMSAIDGQLLVKRFLYGDSLWVYTHRYLDMIQNVGTVRYTFGVGMGYGNIYKNFTLIKFNEKIVNDSLYSLYFIPQPSLVHRTLPSMTGQKNRMQCRRIYDVSGRAFIRDLQYHTIDKLPSGVYFYPNLPDKFTHAKRLLVTR